MTSKIFVQIASYRDPQLLSTVLDCMDKASNPNSIIFGIVEQDSEQTPCRGLPPNRRHIVVDYKKSKGVCWARALANTLYKGEDYILQIDSHTRFDQDWDQILINQIEHSQKQNPVLSCYPNMYWLDDFGEDVYGESGTTITAVTGFREDGSIILEPVVAQLTKQRNAISLAGGFIFAKGKFVELVQYNPDIYFIGEEILLSVQAFTRGFDLVHPVVCPLYHYYVRNDGHRHWADHSLWHIDNEKSLQLVNQHLSNNDNLGKIRTLEQYQEYSGIHFANRTITENALLHIEPKLEN